MDGYFLLDQGGPPQKSQQPSNPVEPEKPKKPSANEQWQALQKQYPGADKVLDFLGKSTLFSTETVVTMGLMRQLLETSPNDTSLIVKYLQKVQEDRTKFSAFPALTNHISTCIQTELMTAELAQKKEKAKKAKKAKKRQRKKERKEREAMEERERQKIASIAHSINGPDNSHNLDDGDDYEDNFGDLESRKLREMQQVHGKGETQAWGGLQNRFNGMGAQGLSGVGRMGLAQTRFANAVVDVSPNNPNSLHFGQPPPPPPALPAYLNDNDHSGFAGGVFERPPARSASEPPHAPNWRDSSNAHNGMGGVTNLDTYKTGLRGLNGSASSSVLPDIPNRLGAQRFPAL